ncbi:MAG: TerC family protein [Saprospiraceae bacterium]|nr:TerC family protein [Saprospiraceae bacterium]
MLIWIGFGVLIAILLALDLGVFNREAHVPSTKEALSWTSLWVTLALSFGGFVYLAYANGWVANADGLSGQEALLKYLTGYLVEQSLSMDNIFVIALIFNYFQIPKKYQHRVLFWGILGAVIFRALMIGIGAVLIREFSWITYVFGSLLLYSAYKMWQSGDEPVDLQNNGSIKFLRRFFPVTTQWKGNQFFFKKMGIWAATPLFVALMVVETTDIMFAFDSIPAIFAITKDPFLVFTSNIFAILGLRSLYFVLASIMDQFKYLKPALIFILFFVGVKMLISHHVHLPEWISLTVIAVSLTFGILASYIPGLNKEKSTS